MLRQLRQAPEFQRGSTEVLVVDNHSPPHRLIRTLRRIQGISLRRWGRNRGYAKAVNEGCRLSRGQWVLLLNPDVTLCDGFLPGVLAVMEQLETVEKRAGIIGFHLRNDDGSRQLSTGVFPTLFGTLSGLLLPRERRKYRRVHARARCRVPWVTGCCCLIRRECWRDLNGMDEDYFLYYEDVDFCRRAPVQGWSVWYEPRLRAIHHRPLHSRQVRPSIRLCTRHALLAYAAKHWGRLPFEILTKIVQVESWCRRLKARRNNDPEALRCWRTLNRVIDDLRAGRFAVARRRVDGWMRKGHGTEPVHRDSQPLPRRSALRVSS
jgi:GT2 family glycosyltransferase